MKFNKILLLGYSKNDFSRREWERIDSLCKEKVILAPENKQLVDHLSDPDCLLVRLGAAIDKKMMSSAPKLKYIGMLGTGFGRIDTKYATSKDICVCNIAGYSTEGVAELAFGLILEHVREISRARAQALQGNYSEAGFEGYEIKNKNFGVIGLGRIGQRVAEIAQGFSANVNYWSKNRKTNAEKKGINYKEADELLKTSDFISLNMAFNLETENFLDDKKIQLIKPGAVIINLAPMELVDLEALTNRLKKNDITFILDHSDELTPRQTKLLSRYSNCIMYPPIGYITKEATEAKLKMFIDNMENYLNGKPTNKVN